MRNKAFGRSNKTQNMLLKDQHFYSLEQQQHQEGVIDSSIILNAGHRIYEGHFPQQPVMPGVCMMQLMAELTSVALGKNLHIKKAGQAKFLIPIIPNKNPHLNIRIAYQMLDDTAVKIKASIYTGTTTFFKFKGLLS